MDIIKPLRDIGALLNSVQNPMRYLGNEFGITVKEDADFTFAVAFPDLYEIGMCNQAVKIIYNGLNRISSVRCERVFAPEPDFEQLLKKIQIPLYTLESGIALHKTDIIGFSIGYELGINGALSILDTGGIPLLKKDRTESHPLVIAGGCGVTNPAPYKDFIDAFFIGEVEENFFQLIEELSLMKKNGASRSDLLNRLSQDTAIWVENAHEKHHVQRAVYSDFGTYTEQNCFPIPNLRIVQDHGVVEIMRGCPNGCRFCHAGLYYRPQRMKDISTIINEVDFLVKKAGYREVSLTSLSSGDYVGIEKLFDVLTKRFSGDNVSFQLPSLKVNSFTLPLLEKISTVRKSGLTFAIETPVEAWQMALNKEVYKERITDIIFEAKKRGWNKAKFYFMVGLPVEYGERKEEEEIVNFMLDIQRRTKIQCSVNVGTFIPKAHTPYQWAAQLSPEQAKIKMDFIRRELPRNYFKVSTHREFYSFLEGMISRGDERVGKIILNAYNRGCRLDAWEDYMKPDLWKEAIDEAGWDVYGEVTRQRSLDETLPWDDISLGYSKAFLKREFERSQKQELSSRCVEDCEEPCGVCNNNTKLSLVSNEEDIYALENSNSIIEEKKQIHEVLDIDHTPLMWRVVFSFTKQNGAEFLPHLGLVETLHKTFMRTGLSIVYSEGFNPLPRLELASTLSIGITSCDEVASCLLENPVQKDEFIRVMTQSLPSFIKIKDACVFQVTKKLKRESLASSLWGNTYTYTFKDSIEHFKQNPPEFFQLAHSYSIEDKQLTAQVSFKHDKKLREGIASLFDKTIKEIFECVCIEKLKTLAIVSQDLPNLENAMICDYFTLYKDIALLHEQAINELIDDKNNNK